MNRVLIRSALSLLVAFSFTACGDDDPATSPQPAPAQPTTPTGETPAEPQAGTWSRVEFSDQVTSPPPSTCSEPERFTVADSGTWTWNFCTDARTGKVEDEELQEVDTQTRAVLESGIEPEFCLELSFDGHQELDIFIRPDREEEVHDLSMSGSCFRGKPQTINPLISTMKRLRLKYAGVEANPGSNSDTEPSAH